MTDVKIATTLKKKNEICGMQNTYKKPSFVRGKTKLYKSSKDV